MIAAQRLTGRTHTPHSLVLGHARMFDPTGRPTVDVPELEEIALYRQTALYPLDCPTLLPCSPVQTNHRVQHPYLLSIFYGSTPRFKHPQQQKRHHGGFKLTALGESKPKRLWRPLNWGGQWHPSRGA